MKEFKVGDTVYFGTLKGQVKKQENDNSSVSLQVKFENGLYYGFTKDGRIINGCPIVINHFPYEIEYKKVEPKIDKDTLVWYRDNEYQSWEYGYYSHFKDGKHYVFWASKKSSETTAKNPWEIVTTENPLK